MVYRPLKQPPILSGADWDAHDYCNRARIGAFYGNRRRDAHQLLVREVASGVKTGRWLDIGCGTGQLLLEAAAIGFQTVGVDLSEAAVARARASDLSAICGRFPDDVPFEVCDVISLIYTLEYVADVKSMLLACRSRLSKDGILVLQLKNLQFWRHAERLFRGPVGIWCPQDLHTFSPAAAASVLLKSGFTVERIRPATLPRRSLANAFFASMCAIGGVILAPSMVVLARPARTPTTERRDASPPVWVRL
jgi:SAM-dependent methyltransferase